MKPCSQAVRRQFIGAREWLSYQSSKSLVPSWPAPECDPSPDRASRPSWSHETRGCSRPVYATGGDRWPRKSCTGVVASPTPAETLTPGESVSRDKSLGRRAMRHRRAFIPERSFM